MVLVLARQGFLLQQLVALRQRQTGRAGGVRVAAGKGFGSAPSKPSKVEDDRLVEGQSGTSARRLKSKGKKLTRPPTPAQQPKMVVEERESLVDQIEFSQRLAALKQEAAVKKAVSALVTQQAVGGRARLDEQASRALALAADPAIAAALLPPDSCLVQVLQEKQSSSSILDSPKASSIYDNPPPLSQTLLGGGKEADRSLAEYEGRTFGPSQAGLAIAAVLLCGVFIVSSGGSDLGFASRRPVQQATTEAAAQLPEEQRKELERELEQFQARLKESEEDLEALESSAVLNVNLGRLQEARELLQRLTAAKPGDAEAWRVLAETQAALGDKVGATGAYRQAWEASRRSSLEVLTGLAGALARWHDSKGQEAVEVVRAAQAAGSAGEPRAQGCWVWQMLVSFVARRQNSLASSSGTDLVSCSPPELRGWVIYNGCPCPPATVLQRLSGEGRWGWGAPALLCFAGAVVAASMLCGPWAAALLGCPGGAAQWGQRCYAALSRLGRPAHGLMGQCSLLPGQYITAARPSRDSIAEQQRSLATPLQGAAAAAAVGTPLAMPHTTCLATCGRSKSTDATSNFFAWHFEPVCTSWPAGEDERPTGCGPGAWHQGLHQAV